MHWSKIHIIYGPSKQHRSMGPYERSLIIYLGTPAGDELLRHNGYFDHAEDRRGKNVFVRVTILTLTNTVSPVVELSNYVVTTIIFRKTSNTYRENYYILVYIKRCATIPRLEVE